MGQTYKTVYNDKEYIMIIFEDYEKMKKATLDIIEYNKILFDQNNKLVENLKIYKKDIESIVDEFKNYKCECDFCIMNQEDI